MRFAVFIEQLSPQDPLDFHCAKTSTICVSQGSDVMHLLCPASINSDTISRYLAAVENELEISKTTGILGNNSPGIYTSQKMLLFIFANTEGDICVVRHESVHPRGSAILASVCCAGILPCSKCCSGVLEYTQKP